MTSTSTDASLRLTRVISRIDALLVEAGGSTKKRLSAQPRVSGRNRVITYRLRVHGRIVEPDWEFELAEILLNVRALLDNQMWALAHADEAVTYTAQEERYITFPIVSTQEAWEHAVRTKAHLNRLSDKHLARVRAMQPIETGDRPDEVLSWVDALHRLDKHRGRLRIVGGLDPQWPMFFHLAPAGSGQLVQDVDWLVRIDEPLRSNVDIVRVTCSIAVEEPGVERVPCALFVEVDGERYDLQDFIWDVQVLVMRAFEVLQGLDPVMYPNMRKVFEYRRDRLAAFNRSMLNGTTEYDKYGKDTW